MHDFILSLKHFTEEEQHEQLGSLLKYRKASTAVQSYVIYFTHCNKTISSKTGWQKQRVLGYTCSYILQLMVR